MRPFAIIPLLFLTSVASAQLVWEKPLAPGLVYREEVDRAAPRVIHAFRITPGSPALRVAPEPTGGAVNEAANAPTGRATVGATAAKSGALAAVNGDFFVDQPTGWNGHSLGLMVRGGELLSAPNPKRAVFAWGPGEFVFGKAEFQGTLRIDGGAPLKLSGVNRAPAANEAVINMPVAGQAIAPEGSLTVILKFDGTLSPTCTVTGTVELVSDEKTAWNVDPGKAIIVARGTRAEAVRGLKPGDRVAVEVRTKGFDWEKLDAAVGGGPMLVEEGETAIDAEDEGFNLSAFVAARHPRTAIGRTADGDLWLVVVDGRSPLSLGASLPELAAIMRRLGCVEAMNLDGGGSTAMAAMGITLNRPSDGHERSVANTVLVRGSAPTPVFGPLHLVVPAKVRDGEIVDAKVLDAKGRSVPNARILWVASGALWMDQGGRLKVIAAGQGIVQAAVDGQVLTAKVTVRK